VTTKEVLALAIWSASGSQAPNAEEKLTDIIVRSGICATFATLHGVHAIVEVAIASQEDVMMLGSRTACIGVAQAFFITLFASASSAEPAAAPTELQSKAASDGRTDAGSTLPP
jgi:hypothetical protein